MLYHKKKTENGKTQFENKYVILLTILRFLLPNFVSRLTLSIYVSIYLSIHRLYFCIRISYPPYIQYKVILTSLPCMTPLLFIFHTAAEITFLKIKFDHILILCKQLCALPVAYSITAKLLSNLNMYSLAPIRLSKLTNFHPLSCLPTHPVQ